MVDWLTPSHSLMVDWLILPHSLMMDWLILPQNLAAGLSAGGLLLAVGCGKHMGGKGSVLGLSIVEMLGHVQFEGSL